MQSSGGLTEAHRFQGKDAILSGPAAASSAWCAPRGRRARAVIGFDMGGTSTDVSHYAGAAGEFERAFETQVAGVRMRAPMMSIHTVAAGGGSILAFDGARLRVGPDSAGANPGPASYRRGGPLAVTDANVHARARSSRRTSRASSGPGRRALDRDGVVRASSAGRRGARGHRPRDDAGVVAEGFLQHRGAEHGQRHQAHLGGARLRRHALHAAVLRRRRRPARLRGGRRAGHDARVRAPAGRRAERLRHGPGRPDRDARASLEQPLDAAGLAAASALLDNSPPRPPTSWPARAWRAATSCCTPAHAPALRGHRHRAGGAVSATLEAARRDFEAAYRQRFSFLMPGRGRW
jgi:5-oxoprolinase (ATP-hydrolysing)